MSRATINRSYKVAQAKGAADATAPNFEKE